MNKKYIITENSLFIKETGKTLYQIQSLVNIISPPFIISKGDFGGYIEHEGNLSQDGECWIFPGCTASDNSRVIQDSILSDNTEISDNVLISGNSVIKEAKLSGFSSVHNSTVSGPFIISNNARIINSIISNKDTDNIIHFSGNTVLDGCIFGV